MHRRPIALGLFAMAIVSVGFAGFGWLLRRDATPAGVGREAPSFVAATLEDPPREKSLADYRGKVVLLNVWATWCGPCRVEMPAIERLHQALGRDGLAVVAVSVDEPGMEPQIRSFVKEYGLTFEVLHDPQGQLGELARSYQITGYPMTVIIGRDGIIRKKLLGAHDWNSAGNRALIARLLAAPQP